MKLRTSLIILLSLLSFTVLAQTTTGLPKATLYDKNGSAVSTSSISDYDNPIVVVTYGKFCDVCTSMLDDVDKQYSKFAASSPVKIIAINIEKNLTATAVFEYAKRWRNIEVLFDKNDEFVKATYTESAPRVFFVDGNQQVVYCHEKKLDASVVYKLAAQIRKGEVKAGKTYFDADWFPTTPALGVYYREMSKMLSGNWSIRDYYKNGKLQMEGDAIQVYPLVRHGLYKYYFSSGKLSELANFKDGVFEGKQTGYYENGNKEFEGTHVSGKLDGQYTKYHQNGKVSLTGTYEMNYPKGKWLYYYDNGTKRKEANYRDGVLDGRVMGWYASGKPKYNALFYLGELKGDPAPVYQLENGSTAMVVNPTGSNGSVRYLFPNGKTFCSLEKVGDQIELAVYFENGNNRIKATMIDDYTIDGKLLEWFENGQKFYELEFDENRPVGRGVVWYKNGVVREKRDFDAGTHEFFDENGKSMSRPATVAIGFKKGEEARTDALFYYMRYLESMIMDDGNL